MDCNLGGDGTDGDTGVRVTDEGDAEGADDWEPKDDDAEGEEEGGEADDDILV